MPWQKHAERNEWNKAEADRHLATFRSVTDSLRLLPMLADAKAIDIDNKKQRSSSFDAPTPQNTPSFSTIIQKMSGNKQQQPTKAEMAAMLQNPALLSALEGRLGQLIGKSSGYIESLPKAVKRRVVALENLQYEHRKLDVQFRAEVLELEKKYLTKHAPLYQKRAAIVQGSVEPTDEECKPREEEDEEDEESEQQQDETQTGEAPAGVPEFWLTAFKNSPLVESMITEHDQDALSKLTDIRVSYLENNPGFCLEFEFAENDFFTNKVLTKTYFLEDSAENDENDVVYDHADGCQIDWKEGKNLTVKIETRKQRHKATNKTRVVKKQVPAESFFNFFSPPAIPDEDDEDADEELGEHLQMDFEIGQHIKESIVARAVDWFTGVAAMDYDEGDEDEFDDEEDFDEEEEEGDSEEEDSEAEGKPRAPAGQTGDKPPECKQQ